MIGMCITYIFHRKLYDILCQPLEHVTIFKAICALFYAKNTLLNSNFMWYQILVLRNKDEVLKNLKTKKLFHECWSICQEPTYNCNKIKQSISDFLYDKMFSFISLSLQMKPCYLHGSRKVIHDYTQSLINVTWFIHQQFLKH